MPPEARRTQFLDAALRVVAEHGLSELTMESVAREAGVAKPVLYSLFRTRSELVSALLRREYAAAVDEVIAFMPRDLVGRDPDDAYIETIRAFLLSVSKSPHRWTLILRSGDDAPPELREHVASARRGVVDHSVVLAKAGLMMRRAPDDLDTELFGHAMLSFAELLGRLHLNDPGRFDSRRLLAFVAGVAAAMPRGAAPTS